MTDAVRARRAQLARWLQRGTERAGPPLDRSGIDPDAFFRVAFGRLPDPAERSLLDGLVVAGQVDSAATAHRVLSAFDAQSHPTTQLVRASEDNLALLDLDDFKLWIDRDDPSVSAFIVNERDWEPHVSRVVRSVLRPGSTFVDVGANIGYHSMLAASLVGPAGSVLAIEPSSENCRLLLLSQLENRFDTISGLPLALDREPGARYLTSHIGTNAGLIDQSQRALIDGYGTLVYARRLDDIAPPRIDLLKVDVEGAEFRVLDGGRATLRRDRPAIVMEFSCEMAHRVSNVDPFPALQNVLDLDYELFVLARDSDERVPFASASALESVWEDEMRIEDLLLVPR